MKEIEILNKITGILENIDGHEVLDVQTRIEKLAAEYSRFSITFNTKKVEENISVPDKPKTEPEENSEDKKTAVEDSNKTNAACCEEETEPVIPSKKAKKKSIYCTNCVNCIISEENGDKKCCKGLKSGYIGLCTTANFCNEYRQK